MSAAGTWKLTINTPMGTQTPTLTLNEEGGKLSGNMEGPMGAVEFSDGTIEGNDLNWEMNIEAMGQKIKLTVTATVDGDSISGKMNSPMGGSDFTGQREG